MRMSVKLLIAIVSALVVLAVTALVGAGFKRAESMHGGAVLILSEKSCEYAL